MTAANTSVETQGPFQVPCKKGERNKLRGGMGERPTPCPPHPLEGMRLAVSQAQASLFSSLTRWSTLTVNRGAMIEMSSLFL